MTDWYIGQISDQDLFFNAAYMLQRNILFFLIKSTIGSFLWYAFTLEMAKYNYICWLFITKRRDR